MCFCPSGPVARTRVCFSRCGYEGRLLVDGAMSMEIPALLARQLGATHVISVHLPAQAADRAPSNVFQVVNRCFQIMQTRTEESWRRDSDLVMPAGCPRHRLGRFQLRPGDDQGRRSGGIAALPKIREWLSPAAARAPPGMTGLRDGAFTPG